MIKQIEVAKRSLADLPYGDRLYHFTADSDSQKGKQYYVAVCFHAATKSLESTCQCWDAFTSFGSGVCKHQKEAMEFMVAKLSEKANAKR